MRVNAGASTVTTLYDRNPTNEFLSVIGVFAAHGDTLRGAYTVPAGRNAIVTQIGIFMERVVLPTTAGTTSVTYRIRDAANQSTIQGLQRNRLDTLEVGFNYDAQANIFLPEAYSFELLSGDPAANGSSILNVSISILEFDA